MPPNPSRFGQNLVQWWLEKALLYDAMSWDLGKDPLYHETSNAVTGLIEIGISITSQIANSSEAIDKRLSSIGSDLKFNNLLSLINTYKLSK